MKNRIEHETTPEEAAERISIQWNLTPDRVTKLSKSLRQLFDEKNGWVHGAITENWEILLGDWESQNYLKKSEKKITTFDIIKDPTLKKPISDLNNLKIINDGNTQDINNVLNLHFSQRQAEVFYNKVLNRSKEEVFSKIEKI